jgi:hypothetical protein
VEASLQEIPSTRGYRVGLSLGVSLKTTCFFFGVELAGQCLLLLRFGVELA